MRIVHLRVVVIVVICYYYFFLYISSWRSWIKRVFFCRHFEQANTESAPSVVQQLNKLLQSKPMFKLLRTMTGLEMADVPLSDDEDDDDDDSEEEENSAVRKLTFILLH